MIHLKESANKGRGVFASGDVPAGTVIETAPVILIPDPGWEELEKTPLRDYYFVWNDEAVAIVLGHGSLYNHSYDPNADLMYRFDERLVDFVALRDIRRGEEICFNYNHGDDDYAPLWFGVA